MDLKKYNLGDIPELKVLGRTTGERNPLTLFWTASGIELNVKAAELWIEISAEYNTFEPWVDILINDALIQRFMVTEGTHNVCIFRNMNPEVVKNVKVLRDTQAMSSGAVTVLQLGAVYTDGSFLPSKQYDLKIEFIGDSITSGEGCTGALEEQDWLPSWMNAVSNYSYMTAGKLNAEYHAISQCGWGFFWSWDGHKEANIPQFYEKICGVISGERNEELGADQPWDFSAWQPDVVIINLGTNDGTPFGFTSDPSLVGDTDKAAEIPAMLDAGYNFLKQLRRCNPQAEIIWCYGMLGDALKPYLLEIIGRYQKDTGDQKIHYVDLEDTALTGVGARSHPGLKCHERAAEILTEVIQKL